MRCSTLPVALALGQLLTLTPLSSALAAGAITSGQSVAGAISGPSFAEVWTFSGTNGDRVLIAAVTTSGALNTVIRLRNPASTEVASTSADRLDYQLLSSGTYTLTIEDSGLNDAGNYSLTLLDVTSGPLTSGPDPDGGPIASAAVVAGQTNAITDFDAYTFTGTAGNRVVIGAIATGGASYNTNLVLYPPGGGVEEANSGTGDRLDLQLAASGTYTIVVEDYLNDHAGSYSLSMIDLTAGPLTSGPDADGGTIASGEIRSAQFQSGPDFDAYRFSGTLGNRILIAAVATGGTPNTVVYLYPPGGGAPVIASGADRADYQLLVSGAYTILIEDSGLNDTGNYELSLLNLTAGPLTTLADPDGGVLPSSAVKTGQTSGVTDFDAFTFSGTAGDRVVFGAIATGGASYNTNLVLYPPGGGAQEANSNTGDRLDVQLAASGTYTIVVEDYLNDHAGSYSLSLINLTVGPLSNASDPDGEAIASGEIRSAQFQSGPDFDAYRFSGTLGNRILIAAVTTGGTPNTVTYLYPPGGGAPVIASGADRTDYQLLASGSYTILIEDSGLNDTGNYELSLLNLTAGPLTTASDLDGGAIASAAVVAGQTNAITDFDAYTFTGTAGNRVVIGAIATGGTSYNTNLVLYPPGGGAQEANTSTGDRLDVQLVMSGSYTIVVEDYLNDHAGSYSLSLIDLAAGPLTSGSDSDGGFVQPGDVKMGQMQTTPDFDAFRFAGAFGDTVRVTATTTLGPLNTTIYIYPPYGAAVVATSADNVTYVMGNTGIHTLLIEDSGLNDAGNYTLSFQKTGGITGVEGPLDPTRVAFSQTIPNPFSEGTALGFSLPGELRVLLRVFDLRGALVRTLMEGRLPAGRHGYRWDGRDAHGGRAADGIYWAELRAGSQIVRRKLVRIR